MNSNNGITTMNNNGIVFQTDLPQKATLKERHFTTLDKSLKSIMLTPDQRVELVLLCGDNHRTFRQAAS